MIHETKDRWVYAAAFGSLTGQLLTLIIAGGALTPITISNEYVNNVFKGTYRHKQSSYILYNLYNLYAYFEYRSFSDANHDDLSTGIFCSFRIHPWISANFDSLDRICLCLIVVSAG